MLIGCAGFREAHDSRVCWHGPWPAIWPDQCEYAVLPFRCDGAVSVPQAAGRTDPGIVVRSARAGHPTAIGELFSHYCPPHCIPIFVDGPSPSQVLDGDARGVLSRAGYAVAADPDAADAELELRLEAIDVRSDPPAFTDLKITTRASVSFSARLRVRSGEMVWSETFVGEEQIRHVYAALEDSEAILGRAYCQALQRFADAASGAGFADGLARSMRLAP